MEYFNGRLPLLFNLAIDPSEQYDVAEKYPELVKELIEAIEDHNSRVMREGSFYATEPG
jgi:hypothetical protein